MRSAVDSSVLLDILGPSARFGPASSRVLQRALAEGALVACEVVWAEVRAYFPNRSVFEGALAKLGVGFEACDPATAEAAGEAWREYRHAGGMRSTIVPDFLVAAHARLQADRLISRDRGFLRSSFSGLKVLDPTET